VIRFAPNRLTIVNADIYRELGIVGALELGYSKSGEPVDVRWDDYRIFETIAKTSSIKRAAITLGTTQSAISKRLLRLEQTLGTRLFDRGPKGALLTYQGERVLTRVLAASKELAQAASDAHRAGCRVEGDCSLQMSDGIANCWITQFIVPFFERYPNIELKIFLDQDMGSSKNQALDIRLHYYEPVDPTKIVRPLASVHFIPFAARSYLEKHGIPNSLGELTTHRFADQAQHLGGKGAWSTWFGDDVVRSTSIFTNQSAFLANCVQEGVGIALMPTYMAISNPELVPLDLDIKFTARLYASYHRERAGSQAVKIVLNFLRGVVFDAKSMPWFDEVYHFPSVDWKRPPLEDSIARLPELPGR
jgi:DNA-binding transcriptional LysR family regulator